MTYIVALVLFFNFFAPVHHRLVSNPPQHIFTNQTGGQR